MNVSPAHRGVAAGGSDGGHTTVLPDALLAPILVGLRDCVCDELAVTVNGPVCWCVIRHGASIVADGCECECVVTDPDSGISLDGQGSAWVRLAWLEPQVAAQTPRCGVAAWAATVELGVWRCAPIPDDGVPDPDQTTSYALAALSDAAALRRVVSCCTALSDIDLTVGRWLPLGPSGGCAGGALQATLSLTGT